MKKSAQFEMSFGFIFSIILIAVFVVVAFIAIRAFLGVQCSVSTGSFVKDLQNEVDRIWAGSGESFLFSDKLAGNCKLKEVCFFDPNAVQNGNYVNEDQAFRGNIIGTNNMYFYPQTAADVPSVKINHINMQFNSNPYCFSINNSQISIQLTKEPNGVLVRVS